MSRDAAGPPRGGSGRRHAGDPRALVADRERRLDERAREIAGLRHRLEAREADLAGILGSRSWRLLRPLRGVIRLLAPAGTRRRRAAGRVRRTCSACFRSVWHARQRLAGRARLAAMRLRRTAGVSLVTVGPASPPAPVASHDTPVDVIVCVHNAPDDTRRCLESIVRTTTPPYRLILVDDGSQAAARDYLSFFSESQGSVLFRNEKALGYTRAANIGLDASSAPWAVLLNSDTVVTPGWLDRMVACGESAPDIGLVGPLSNTASWQSVPEVVAGDGDWAGNPLPPGVGPAEMAERLAASSARLYPRLPFLNGFCLMIRRTVREAVGRLDEEAFPDGYGEENDYCLRARKAGFALAVADDVFVYHAQSSSYSHDRRKQLVERSNAAVAAKHGAGAVGEGAAACRADRVLEGVRARVRVDAARRELAAAGRDLWEGRRVLFLLPVAEPGGGSHVVIQEARAMQRMGVDVRLANLRSNQPGFSAAFPALPVPVHYVDTPKELGELIPRFDAVVGTVCHTIEWMVYGRASARTVQGYYIQDFEPFFFPGESPGYEAALASYSRISDLVRTTKTEWNRRMVREHAGVDCHVVGPSVDIDLYRPRPVPPGRDPRTVTVAAMVRPSTPRRQAGFTMQVLRRLVERQGRRLRAVVFGCQPGDPGFLGMNLDFPFDLAGVLTRGELAVLLAGADVFVDLSAYQAMGLTALEAMASGAAVVVPAAGGAGSFARHDENALVVDTSDAGACLAAVERLVEDPGTLERLRLQGARDACAFFPERAAYETLKALFGFPERGAAR